MIRIPYEGMCTRFAQVLEGRGMEKEDAELCARLLAETSLEGVYTHGAHRFPFLIKTIDEGSVDVHAHPQLVESLHSLERWDGNRGMGNLNAYHSMHRAIALAKEHTIGCVALANTNHWMRPGTYGLMATQEDCIGMLWTNTMPLMPAWGGLNAKVGNNPLVLSIPSKEGPVLVDMAMSLFSYGKLETYEREGKPLPVPGGYDETGKLTTDATAIQKTRRPLPIGFWKGTSLALALDLIVAVLSGGKTTYQIGLAGKEAGVSQIFFAIDLSVLSDRETIQDKIEASLADLRASIPADGNTTIHFPGEHRVAIREENLRLGIPTDERVWEEILAF